MWTRLVVWEDTIDVLPEMPCRELAEHVAKISGDGQIPLLVELLGCEARPATVNVTTEGGAPHDEHHVAVSVIGPVVAVLLYGPSEFRHRHQHDVLHPIAHVARECGQRVAELLE